MHFYVQIECMATHHHPGPQRQQWVLEKTRKGGDEENRPKQRESRRLGHLVSVFFCVFFYTYTNHLTATMDTSKLWRYLREVATKRTGPNNMIHIVWAISTCFFLPCLFFLKLILIYNKYRCYGATEGLRES